MQWSIDFVRQPLRARFAPDGSSLAICGGAGVALHDPANGQVRAQLSGHRGGVQDVQFTPDSAAVWTLGDDGTLRMFHAADGSALATMRAHDGRGAALAIAPDGSRLATCGEDDRLVLWDVAARTPVWSRGWKDGYKLTFSADGKRLWALPLGRELLRFDTEPAARRQR
jgi:WD40 repeat protein